MTDSFTAIRQFALQVGQWSRERYAERPVRTAVLLYSLALGTAVLLWVGIAAYSAAMVREDVNELTSVTDNPGSLELSQESIGSLHATSHSLERHLGRLERLTRVPLLEEQLYRIPVVGPRYEAGRVSLKLGKELSQAGVLAADIGKDAYRAYDASGISYESDETETWLTSIHRHSEDIPTIASHAERSLQYREQLDEALLPATLQRRIETLDRFLDRSDDFFNLAENYDQFFRAAGGEGTVRYLFLFKNPAELRPSGGFPGTFGVFEFRSGQLVDYEMWDSHDITTDYIERRSEVLEQPWPFEQFAPQDGFLLHDATWYSDFPKSAEIIMEMYAETAWPEIHGIVAVQPEAVSNLVRVSGPVEVEIEDEIREINEGNVYDEVERYRWLRFAGEREGELGDHKDILIDIGEAIMDRLTEGDDTDTVEAVRLLLDAADRRDLQMYVDEPEVQAFLDRQGWTGRLFPNPETPTIAITYTNFVLEKASMAINPSYDLHLGQLDDGSYRGVMRMTLEHTGKHDQDPRYFGFQRWWVEVALPEGAELISSNYEPQPDPEAHNGGSYKVNLFPEETKELHVSFTLPELDELMLRRQPGQVPPNVHVHMSGCETVWGGYLIQDLYIQLNDECPVIEDIQEERPEMLQLS